MEAHPDLADVRELTRFLMVHRVPIVDLISQMKQSSQPFTVTLKFKCAPVEDMITRVLEHYKPGCVTQFRADPESGIMFLPTFMFSERPTAALQGTHIRALFKNSSNDKAIEFVLVPTYCNPKQVLDRVYCELGETLPAEQLELFQIDTSDTSDHTCKLFRLDQTRPLMCQDIVSGWASFKVMQVDGASDRFIKVHVINSTGTEGKEVHLTRHATVQYLIDMVHPIVSEPLPLDQCRMAARRRGDAPEFLRFLDSGALFGEQFNLEEYHPVIILRPNPDIGAMTPEQQGHEARRIAQRMQPEELREAVLEAAQEVPEDEMQDFIEFISQQLGVEMTTTTTTTPTTTTTSPVPFSGQSFKLTEDLPVAVTTEAVSTEALPVAVTTKAVPTKAVTTKAVTTKAVTTKKPSIVPNYIKKFIADFWSNRDNLELMKQETDPEKVDEALMLAVLDKIEALTLLQIEAQKHMIVVEKIIREQK